MYSFFARQISYAINWHLNRRFRVIIFGSVYREPVNSACVLISKLTNVLYILFSSLKYIALSVTL